MFELQRAHVGAYHTHGKSLRRAACGQHFEQRRNSVRRPHLATAPRQVKCDAAGAAAQVQHRAVNGVGQPLPDGEVRRVATALDIVPNGRRGHVQ
ncbi:MAG: hypothetical protein AUG48_06250 [Actinobacteria bacterium 13_1_20CM_3_68_9]|nr:MAG: hypothetical protein AUG48_06250 [Actinobacteria bacterium 13_1_20CM_3_68_9]